MARLLFLLLLAGCAATPEQLATGAMAVSIGSIAVIQRSPLDAAYSVLSGRDCSVVRLEQGKSYCRPVEPPPEWPRLAELPCGKPGPSSATMSHAPPPALAVSRIASAAP